MSTARGLKSTKSTECDSKLDRKCCEENDCTQLRTENHDKLFSYNYENYEFSYSSLKLTFDKHENAIKFYKLIKQLKGYN